MSMSQNISVCVLRENTRLTRIKNQVEFFLRPNQLVREINLIKTKTVSFYTLTTLRQEGDEKGEDQVVRTP